MKAVAINMGVVFKSQNEITNIEYKSGRLEITSQSLDETRTVGAIFLEVAGFRVLDEADLLEFWPTCSSTNGWVFQINEGGWFAQERLRTGFFRGDIEGINEYLVTGISECVSVFAWAPPELYFNAP